ncbi:MAG: PQQ-binding-like beta-propeller repeat protein [Acidobacteriota bacterium]
MRRLTTFAGCLITLMILIAIVSDAADWPQWRGPNRDGVSKETGLLKSWPPSGPKVRWKVPLGGGYSSIAVSQGRVYTMASIGGNEVAVCLDDATGKQLWNIRMDSAYQSGQGDGPRSTPIVDGNWVYVLGAQGKLYALNAKDGKKIWSHDLKAEYGSEIPGWGTSTSPLIEGDLLLVDIGGKTGHSIGAFNKKSGALVWKTHTDKQGYSSPIAVTVNGGRQILFFTGTGLVSVSPTGTFHWKYPWRTSYYANIATPLIIPPNKVFISTAYGTGAALLKLTGKKEKPSFQEVWKSKVSQNHFNSSVFYNNHIYGFDSAILQCVEANSGTEKWKKSGFGKGSVILADGHLYVLGERGQLALVEATPAGYKEKGQVQALNGKTWTSPALANGNLYLRNEKEIISMSVK